MYVNYLKRNQTSARTINRKIAALKKYNLKDIEDAKNFCLKNGVDVEKIVREIQPICFDNAVEAYALGTAIALKSNCKNACEAAEKIGEGLQAYCTIGSVADERKIGLGHGNLASRLLDENTKCFCFLAGHGSCQCKHKTYNSIHNRFFDKIIQRYALFAKLSKKLSYLHPQLLKI